MAILGVSAMPAMQLRTPEIDAVGAFQQGRRDAQTNESIDLANLTTQMEMLAHGAASALDQGPAGPVNVENWGAFLDYIERQGVDPQKVATLRENPEVARVLLMSSADALKVQDDATALQQAAKLMDEKITAAIRDNSTTPAPAVETSYDSTGREQKLQWNSQEGVWEPFGSPGPGEPGLEDESWYGTPVYLRDPASGEIVIGQMSNRNRFKPMQGAEGMDPAIPVTQLDTGTAYVPKDKYGNDPGIAPTPIDNAGAEFDKKVGGDLGEQIIGKRDAALDAQLSLQANAEARRLLDAGVITGFAADFKVGLGKALQSIGFNVASDAIANSEAFVATRAQEVGRLIKLFGAGTGLSDADRDYAERAAAGQINLTEESIRKILEISDRAARNVIIGYNATAKDVENGGRPNLQIDDGDDEPGLPDPFAMRQ